MEKFVLYFPNAGQMAFLQFSSELQSDQGEFEVEPPIERRGYQNVADFLKILSKPKRRKKLITKIVKHMRNTGIVVVFLMLPDNGPVQLSIEIRIDNSTTTIYNKGTGEKVVIDSVNVDSEIERMNDSVVGN